MFDLKAYLAVQRERVDAALDAVWVESSPSTRLTSAMRYSLTAGGKRLRPILCLAAAEAVGGAWADALSAACALELIHTYSLIHDDLPAMDDDALRRGKPTCHKAFDEATAILAGDGLLTLAFQVLSGPSSVQKGNAEGWLRVIGEISHAAGYQGMIEGQMRDMDGETHGFDLKDLESMHRLKTGALIQAAVRTGAILGGGTEDMIHRLDRFGGNIGLAFQVTDDILNVEGDPAVMGKAAGTDTTRNKNTYPSLLGLAESKAFAERLIQEALGALAGFNSKSEPLRAIARYILDRRR